MRAVVQRVIRGSVKVDDRVVGSVNRGLVVLIGVGEEDALEDAQYLAKKILGLRIFDDGEGKMNLSVSDIGGEVLAVSQFTLYGDARKGKRPSYSQAAVPEKAAALYDSCVQALREAGVNVATGIFQAMMEVEIINDGPVTLLLDSKRTF